jgi:hypothetical protein
MRRLPTAPLAAGSLIAGYAVAAGSGSRPLGGLVLAAGGLCCARAWYRRHDARTSAELTGAGVLAFAASHLLALAVGPWPSVLSLSAALAALVWARADRRPGSAGAPIAFRVGVR